MQLCYIMSFLCVCMCDLLSCVLYQHLLLFVPTTFLHVQVSLYTHTEVKHSLSIHCGLLCFIYIKTHTHSDVCACPCMLILLIFFHPLPPSPSLPLPPSPSLPLPPSLSLPPSPSLSLPLPPSLSLLSYS